MWMARVLFFGLALLWAAPARAGCQSDAQEWARRAPAGSCELRPVVCLPGGVVVEISDNPALRVEIRQASPGAFRTLRGVSLLPVLEVSDWSLVPAPQRAAFEKLAGCIEQHPEPFPLAGSPPAGARGSPSAEPHGPPSPAGLPPGGPAAGGERPSWWSSWRLVLGLLAGLLSCAGSQAAGEQGASRRAMGERVAAFLGLPLVAVIAWWALYSRGFLHPNGQAPMWVGFALEPGLGFSPYGPGFAELFGPLAAAFPGSPERAIFAGNTALCALVPPAAWWVLRRGAVPGWLAWATAGSLALLPALGREAQSQSYYASCTALLALGAAALLAGPRQPGSRRSWGRVALSIVGAGLLIAQAARVHPICWTAAAAAPLVLLARPGRARATLLRLGMAFVGVFLTLLLSSGAALRGVWQESLGTQWAAQGLAQILPRLIAPAVLGGAAVAAMWVFRARRVGAALVAGGILLVLLGPRLIGRDLSLYQRGFELLFLGALLGPVSVLLAAGGRVRAAAAVATLAGALFSATSAWPEARLMSTNAVEQEAFIGIRSSLPEGAAVVYLSRTEKGVFSLPIYRNASPLAGGRLRAFPLRVGDAAPKLPPGAYYYRSSLCSTEDGQAACAALEARWKLMPVMQRSLAARTSSGQYDYRQDPVEVGLFRVENLPD